MQGIDFHHYYEWKLKRKTLCQAWSIAHRLCWKHFPERGKVLHILRCIYKDMKQSSAPQYPSHLPFALIQLFFILWLNPTNLWIRLGEASLFPFFMVLHLHILTMFSIQPLLVHKMCRQLVLADIAI